MAIKHTFGWVLGLWAYTRLVSKRESLLNNTTYIYDHVHVTRNNVHTEVVIVNVLQLLSSLQNYVE